MGRFMKGLKTSIKAAVRTLRPKSLEEAMSLAQLVEDREVAERPSRIGNNPQRAMSGQVRSVLGVNQSVGRDILKENGRENVQIQPTAFKHMTEAEIQAKRARGL